MDRETFNAIKSKAGSYAFTSLSYLEYEHVASYHVITDSPDLILITGHSETAGCREVHWAANDAETLIRAARAHACPVLITFVPGEWKARFMAQGFTEYGVLREYWIDALQNPGPPALDCAALQHSECEQAAAVTVSCRNQSREFHGETAEWLAGWMRGEDADADACSSRDCTILACRENEQPVGIVCVAIYGDKSPKGPIVWIREIAVTPDYQGRGYGRALLQSALAYGTQRGAKRAFLMADDCNAVAISLYRSLGFTPNMSEAQIDLIREAPDVR
ncbi:MAG: GNAT family N-acetyltransferase [Bacillota bacterium]